MAKTKQKIQDTARRLFNEKGFSQVTIRMIASELGMSSGNLNYHFRKREDILEALYAEMVEVFDRRAAQVEEQEITLAHMQTEIQQSMQRMVAYRFFWTDLYNLLNQQPGIAEQFRLARKVRIAGYQFVFKTLIQQEILLPPAFPQEHQLLMERMIDYSNTWIYISRLRGVENPDSVYVEKASFDLLAMLFPLLSPEGKQQFKSLYPGFTA